MTGKRAPVHFDDMIAACESEATRIAVCQDFLVDTAIRKEPAPGELRRKEVFEAIVRLIEIVRVDEIILARIAVAVKRANEAIAREAVPDPDKTAATP